MKHSLAIFGIIVIASMGVLFVSFSSSEGKFVFWDTYRRAPGSLTVKQVGTPYHNIPSRGSYRYIYASLKHKSENVRTSSTFKPYEYTATRTQQQSEFQRTQARIKQASAGQQRRLGSGQWTPPPVSSAQRRLAN